MGVVLDALDQALHDRRPVHYGGLVHHCDRGSQYVSIRYSERLSEAGIEPSVGSVAYGYDNALAEMINGLYKAEVIPSARTVAELPSRGVRHARMDRLVQQPVAFPEPNGNIPPVEAEEYAAQAGRTSLGRIT